MVSFIVEANQFTHRIPLTFSKSLTNFSVKCFIEYTTSGVEVVCRCRSNYRMILFIKLMFYIIGIYTYRGQGWLNELGSWIT